MLFVISSPSGCGKNTIINEIRKTETDVEYSISATTRPPRKGEKEGVNYFFYNETTFQNAIKAKAFLEWECVYGFYYGTLWKQVKRFFNNDKKGLLDIDIKGGLRLKKLDPETVLVFLLPPSLDELKKRLIRRGTDSSDEITKRLQMAQHEIKIANKYDFQLINDNLEETADELRAILNNI